jgi:hypothetical protein
MNAVNGVILIMVAIFGLYLLWAVNSPLFNRQVTRTSGGGESQPNTQNRAVSGVANDATDNTVGPAEEAYYDSDTQADGPQ